jgi:hypothetical protein
LHEASVYAAERPVARAEEDSVAVMKVALRVIRAISERRPADPADVAMLRGECADNLADDELACEVIRRRMRKKSQASG